MLDRLNDTKMTEDAKFMLADRVWEFITDYYDVEMAVRWLEKGYVYTGGDQCGKPEFRLLNSTKGMNIQFLKAIYASKVVPLETKLLL